MDIYFREPDLNIFKEFHQKTNSKLNICFDYHRLKNKFFTEVGKYEKYSNKCMLDSGSIRLGSKTKEKIFEDLKNRYFNFLSENKEKLEETFEYILSFVYTNKFYDDNLSVYEKQLAIYEESIPIIQGYKTDIDNTDEYLELMQETYAVNSSLISQESCDILKDKTDNKKSIHLCCVKNMVQLNKLNASSFDTDLWLSDSKKGILNQFLLEENYNIVIKKISFEDNSKAKSLKYSIVSKDYPFIDNVFEEAKEVFKINFDDFYNSKKYISLKLMNIYQIYKLNKVMDSTDKPLHFSLNESKNLDETSDNTELEG